MAVQKEAGSGDGPDGRMAKRNEIQHTHTHTKKAQTSVVFPGLAVIRKRVIKAT